MKADMIKEPKEIIQKYISQMDELKERSRNADLNIMSREEFYETMETLRITGKLPAEITEWLLSLLHEKESRELETEKIIENGHIMQAEEALYAHQEKMSPDEIVKMYENSLKYAQLYELVCGYQRKTNQDEISTQLFKNIDPRYEFPTVKAIMDRIFHFPELMKKAELHNITRDEWMLCSKIGIENDKEFIGHAAGDYKGDAGPIGFEYSFSASSEEEAKKNSDAYKKEMLENGIKNYMAFSKMMHEKNSPHYSCKITDVMKLAADPERKNYFTQKEKSEFWRTARMLERTKLTIVIPVKVEKKVRTKYTTVTEKVSIDLRMLNITLKDATKKIPSFFQVSILDVNKFKDKSTLATRIANETLLLKPNRRLAFGVLLQIFLEQQRGKVRTRDENSLIELAGLQETAKANIRVARARLKEDLDELTEKKIISGWSEKDGRYNFKPLAHKKLAYKNLE